MRQIDVEAIHDGTFIFTVTERDQAPWGSTNTTIFIPPEQLAEVVAKLQVRLHEVEQARKARLVFAPGQDVRIIGHFHHGQQGTVIAVEQKEARMQQKTGEQWSYRVAFGDGSTWAYNADELEQT